MNDLDAVRSHIRAIAERLDPQSRYISEILATVDASSSVADFERRLEGSRAERHAGRDVFASMTLAEKVLASLVTAETTLFRFSEGEMEAIDRYLLPHLGARRADILIVPCSHGEEAYTIAAYFLKVGLEFRIRAFDIQPALVEEARTGRLTFGYPIDFLAAPGFVAKRVLDRIDFCVGDAFDLPLGPSDQFDLVLSRNFLGYFVEPAAVAIVESLRRRVRSGGVLFLDGYCVAKHPAIERSLLASRAERLFGRPAFAVP